MQLLSSGRRGEIYLIEKDKKKIAVKKAKDQSKAGAIQREITILKKLKWKVNFVPQILDYGSDWFSYEFIEWVTLNKIKSVKPLVYKKLIEYAYTLDLLWVEHWELSRPTKNIIINENDEVFIIDFERWNLMNNSYKNLKALWQLFLSKWWISKENLKFESHEKFKDFLTNKMKSILS